MLKIADHKIVIIQARMASSRLPGKVLADIHGRPMLQHVIERSMRAELIDDIVLATTTDSSDDVLEQFCHVKGIPCYRGSPIDVLDRYYRAARQFHADVIIRLTADCPLIDPEIIDRTISAFFNKTYPAYPSDEPKLPNTQLPNTTVPDSPSPASSLPDYSSTDYRSYASPSPSSPLPDYSLTDYSSPATESPNRYPSTFAASRLPPPWKRTLPIGLDVEVCSFNALERAFRKADQLYQREHVMPYLYEGVIFPPGKSLEESEWYITHGLTPHGWKVALLNHHPDYGSLRWTVDTPNDLEFVRQVYAHFGAFEYFDWHRVLMLLEDEPGLAAINAEVPHKTAFDVDQRTPSV